MAISLIRGTLVGYAWIRERVHGLRGASYLNPRGARSIVGVETMTSLVLCGDFHVRPELAFQVGVAPGWKQRSPKTLNPFAKKPWMRFH
jgi:hypothetical protein